MYVYIDNIGAIDMLHNQSTKARTKHVDIRYHWLRNYEQEGFIKINFKQSEENTPMTKNVSKVLFDKHVPNLVSEQNYHSKNRKVLVLLVPKDNEFIYNNLSKN